MPPCCAAIAVRIAVNSPSSHTDGSTALDALDAPAAPPPFATTTLFVPRSLRAAWITSRIPQEWFEDFSGFFNREDLSITRNQNLGHFGEWVAALDYRLHGYEVLIEKYVYKPKTQSYDRAKEILAEHFEFVRAGSREPPDLLVIPPRSDYFFAAVKMSGDRLRPPQLAWFREIARVTGRSITLVQIRYTTT